MFDYALFNRALAVDLTTVYDAKADVVVGLMRHFSPTHKEYVMRVTAWQQFLCVGTSDDLPCGPLLVRAGVAQVWGTGFALRVDCTPTNIFIVNQIAMLYWKEEIAVEPDWDSFKTRLASSGTPDLNHPIIGKLAEWVSNLLGQAPSWDEIEGTCGSGATAERRTSRDRWYFDTIPLGVPRSFYQFNQHDQTPAESMIPWARASAVPKNRKSARLVASECASSMFAQLGVMRAFDSRLCKIWRKVPIRNADIHRAFLRRDSVATLDLSDASDYISMDLANAILPPDWATLCNGCRSQVVLTPDGEATRLSTFAPMGNGFCFRTLSLICAGILAVTCDYPWSDFGDDMICHRKDVPAVTMGLEACGLRLNASKSCYGRYVESCGDEVFDGVLVTPLKLKRLLTYKGQYADIGAAARAASRGLYTLAAVLCPHEQSWRSRYNRFLQISEVRVPCWRTDSLDYECDGWPGLLRWRCTRGENFSTTTQEYAHTYAGFRWCRSETDSISEADLEEIHRLSAVPAVWPDFAEG